VEIQVARYDWVADWHSWNQLHHGGERSGVCPRFEGAGSGT
jgi:hypothetical protein